MEKTTHTRIPLSELLVAIRYAKCNQDTFGDELFDFLLDKKPWIVEKKIPSNQLDHFVDLCKALDEIAVPSRPLDYIKYLLAWECAINKKTAFSCQFTRFEGRCYAVVQLLDFYKGLPPRVELLHIFDFFAERRFKSTDLLINPSGSASSFIPQTVMPTVHVTVNPNIALHLEHVFPFLGAEFSAEVFLHRRIRNSVWQSKPLGEFCFKKSGPFAYRTLLNTEQYFSLLANNQDEGTTSLVALEIAENHRRALFQIPDLVDETRRTRVYLPKPLTGRTQPLVELENPLVEKILLKYPWFPLGQDRLERWNNIVKTFPPRK